MARYTRKKVKKGRKKNPKPDGLGLIFVIMADFELKESFIMLL
jgi:hypothetical protein